MCFARNVGYATMDGEGDGGTRKPVRLRRGPATVIGERIPTPPLPAYGWEGRDEL
ncbi:hypothetical protein Ssi02_08800 [Sinosporangium siamense]|uniref:Uncharacterized protein n=1 Tax=Sinosporangium siamense TaxID=1367973 RepID=A0A919VA14_9ACTN|nr:hypothetical protein Ssi02_08800 [Sinosporangium siamense]